MIDYLSRARVRVTYSPIAATKQIRVQTEDRTRRRGKKTGQTQKRHEAWKCIHTKAKTSRRRGVSCLLYLTTVKSREYSKKRNEQALFESSRSKINIYCFFFSTKVGRTNWASTPAPSLPESNKSEDAAKILFNNVPAFAR